jgi:membrane protein implicated in regulation of membrane protease activity
MDTYIWLALMVIFLVIEGACAIHLVSIWFAAGSLVAMVVSQLSGPVWLQILLFALVSGGLLAGLWPFTKKFLNPRIVKTNVDSVIGSQGYVIGRIDNVHAQGQVKLAAMEWTARSTSGDPIEEGTLVQVDRVEGVKVFVSPVKVQETV